MSIDMIRERLIAYMQSAEDKKLEAIYTMLEEEICTDEHSWDDAFIAEMERRSTSYNNGSAKTYSWEETKAMARHRVAEKKSGNGL